MIHWIGFQITTVRNGKKTICSIVFLSSAIIWIFAENAMRYATTTTAIATAATTAAVAVTVTEQPVVCKNPKCFPTLFHRNLHMSTSRMLLQVFAQGVVNFPLVLCSTKWTNNKPTNKQQYLQQQQWNFTRIGKERQRERERAGSQWNYVPEVNKMNWDK